MEACRRPRKKSSSMGSSSGPRRVKSRSASGERRAYSAWPTGLPAGSTTLTMGPAASSEGASTTSVRQHQGRRCRRARAALAVTTALIRGRGQPVRCRLRRAGARSRAAASPESARGVPPRGDRTGEVARYSTTERQGPFSPSTGLGERRAAEETEDGGRQRWLARRADRRPSESPRPSPGHCAGPSACPWGVPGRARSTASEKADGDSSTRRREVVRRHLVGLLEVRLGLRQLPVPLQKDPQVLESVRAVVRRRQQRVKAACASSKRQSSNSATARS